MPKKLSDITYQYERTADDLEQAEDSLTAAVEAARTKVNSASQSHRGVASDLLRYLREHPDEVVVANDYGYHYDPNVPGSIRRRSIFWAHHIWVDDQDTITDSIPRLPSRDGNLEPTTYRVPVNEGEDIAIKDLIAAWDLGIQEEEIAS